MNLGETAEFRPVSADINLAVTHTRVPVAPGESPSPELQDGNVLRRFCKLGGEACAASCQAALVESPEWVMGEGRCADLNLKNALDRLLPDGVKPLMIGVSADRVGFADQIETYRQAGDVNVNSQGVTELMGFNAFFARTDDFVALGSRLADCGYLGVEFKDCEEQPVFGFVHLTRPNMQGDTALDFEVSGRPAGAFEYFLTAALKHYGADKDSVKVRVAAAVTGENFVFRFTGDDVPSREDKLHEVFPGWLEQGMIHNAAYGAEWEPGKPILKTDKWIPHYRQMVRWQIERAGITPDQIIDDDCIDPGALELGHASDHNSSPERGIPKARDLYLAMPSQSRVMRDAFFGQKHN